MGVANAYSHVIKEIYNKIFISSEKGSNIIFFTKEVLL